MIRHVVHSPLQTDETRGVQPSLTLAPGSARLILRTEDREELIEDGDTLEVNGRTVIVVVAHTSEPFCPGEAARVTVEFCADEEVTVLIARGQKVSQVTAPRQAALVAELVGRRLRDRRRGVSGAHEGWTDKFSLARAMGIDPDYVNTLLLRLREGASRYGFSHHSHFIQSQEAPLYSVCKARRFRIAVAEVRIV